MRKNIILLLLFSIVKGSAQSPEYRIVKINMNNILICLAAIFIVACQGSGSSKKENIVEMKELTGEWNNLSIKVDINSKSNSDTSEVLEVNRPEWEKKLKIKPIRTFFRSDSTWNSAHYNLKDSLVYNPSGKWWLEADKLVMLRDFPSPDTTTYSLVLKKDTASFEAMLDWDMDGKKDDKYFGRQLKVNK